MTKWNVTWLVLDKSHISYLPILYFELVLVLLESPSVRILALELWPYFIDCTYYYILLSYVLESQNNKENSKNPIQCFEIIRLLFSSPQNAFFFSIYETLGHVFK